jgi:hypothetical protein
VAVEALLAVDCDHRREQHDPVGDNRFHGAAEGAIGTSRLCFCALPPSVPHRCAKIVFFWKASLPIENTLDGKRPS